jgi:hypothetical protein
MSAESCAQAPTPDVIVSPPFGHEEGMSDETTPSTITEALERAARLHAETLRQIEELLRDEDVVELDDVPLDVALSDV